MSESSSTKKLSLSKDEVLFSEGDCAKSLYIIQKGQLRLYRPKGNDIVDIAVVRQGEVLGEMSYFDKDQTNRSVSASAMIPCEVVEISFEAFGKALKDVSPWISTIINTLVSRLKKANSKIKLLDTASGIDYSGQAKSAVVVKPNEVSKILATLYLSLKTRENCGQLTKTALSKATLLLFANDVYGIAEAKIDHVLFLLRDMQIIDIVKDSAKDMIVVDEIDEIKSLFVFYNTQRHLQDNKRINVSNRCSILLEEVWKRVKSATGESNTVQISLRPIFESFRDTKFTTEDLNDAVKYNLTEDVLVDGDSMILPVYKKELEEHIHYIIFTRHLSRVG